MVTKKDFVLVLEILRSIEHNGYKLFYLGEEVVGYDLDHGWLLLKDESIIKYRDFNKTSEILEKFTINIRADEILKNTSDELGIDDKALRRFLLKLGLATDRSCNDNI